MGQRAVEITDADNVESTSLAAHVAMCRMRHGTIVSRLGRVEYLLYVAVACILVVTGRLITADPETAAALLKVLAAK